MPRRNACTPEFLSRVYGTERLIFDGNPGTSRLRRAAKLLNGSRQCDEGSGMRVAFLPARHRTPAIAADAHIGIERQLSEKRNVHGLGSALAAALAENVDPLTRSRRNQIAHVFDQP